MPVETCVVLPIDGQYIMYAQIQPTFWLSNGIQFYCIAISILGSKGFLFELFRSSSGIKILWLLFEFKYQPNINSS
jgi:hypothetical protein